MDKIFRNVLIATIITLVCYICILLIGKAIVPTPKNFNFLWAIFLPVTALAVTVIFSIYTYYVNSINKPQLDLFFSDDTKSKEITPKKYDVKKIEEQKQHAIDNKNNLPVNLVGFGRQMLNKPINDIAEIICDYKNKELITINFNVKNQSQTDADRVEINLLFPKDFIILDHELEPDYIGRMNFTVIPELNNPNRFLTGPFIHENRIRFNYKTIRASRYTETDTFYIKPPLLKQTNCYGIKYSLHCLNGRVRHGELKITIESYVQQNAVMPTTQNNDEK